jgi:hypothetical protein
MLKKLYEFIPPNFGFNSVAERHQCTAYSLDLPYNRLFSLKKI